MLGLALRDSPAALMRSVGDLPVALAFLVGGFLLFGAADAFRQIATTQGDDMGLLMRACEKLSKLMSILLIAFAVALALYVPAYLLASRGGT